MRISVRKTINPYPLNDTNNLSNLSFSDYRDSLNVFKGKTFLEFNDIIGLPIKNGKEHPIYDYELDVVDKIENNRNIWIKKAAGIGATELVLRYLTWKILRNNDLEYKHVFIISGTHLVHAHDVKERMQNLFRDKFPLLQLESKFTDLWIKNTNIKIFPSRNVKDLRGYTDVSYLFIDEADHFEPSVNDELLHAITRYEEKSHCTTIMCSTPNAPGGLYESIERDPDSKYCKIILDYTLGLDKIYNRQEIANKMEEPTFPREYQGMYPGKTGNVFSPNQVNLCVTQVKELGVELDKYPVNHNVSLSLGLDPGFSTSRTALVLVEHLEEHNKIRVVYSEELDGHPSYDTIVKKVWDLYRQYGHNMWVYVDGSARGLITSLKIAFDENIHYQKAEDVSLHANRIIPVNFVQEHKLLLQNLYSLISNQYLCIPEQFEKVIISLKSAVANEYSLDKTQSSYNDTLDALRLACRPFHFD